MVVLSAFLGATRTVTNKVLQGDYAGAKLSLNLAYRAFPRSVLPNEFAAIASTTHFVLGKNPESYDGESYLNSFVHPIPRRFLKVEKPIPIADQLSSAWAKELFTYDPNCLTAPCVEEKQDALRKRQTFSLGISPVAEAIWNFGVYWPFVCTFCFHVF